MQLSSTKVHICGAHGAHPAVSKLEGSAARSVCCWIVEWLLGCVLIYISEATDMISVRAWSAAISAAAAAAAAKCAGLIIMSGGHSARCTSNGNVSNSSSGSCRGGGGSSSRGVLSPSSYNISASLPPAAALSSLWSQTWQVMMVMWTT